MKVFLESIRIKHIYDNIDVVFFLGFLVTLPLSIRKVIWYFPLREAFNEYADISIYLSDIFLIFATGIWIVNLYTKSNILSIVCKCFTWNILLNRRVEIFVGVFPLGLIFFAILSLINSKELIIGVFSIIKLLEYYVLYLFLIFRIVPYGTIRKIKQDSVLEIILKIIMFSGVFESFIGIIQFLQQHSLGLVLLKESVINATLPGVAKIVVHGTRYIRAYGTFPHPNILGGFLLFSIILSHLYVKIYYTKKVLTRWQWQIILYIQYIGVVLTFSKSAMIGLMLALAYIVVVSRGTFNLIRLFKTSVFCRIKNLFHVKQGIFQVVWLVTGSFLVVAFFSQVNFEKLFFQSLREREVYQFIAQDIIYNHPILGISCGQLVIFMSQQGIYPLFDWQLQPVHNVFLLVWAESGIGAFSFFVLGYLLLMIGSKYDKKQNKIDKMNFKKFVPRETIVNNLTTSVYLRAIIIGFLPSLLFDHYLWDIQQGQLILWLTAGMLAGFILQHKSLNKANT